MKAIGLTGSFGTGKSFVASIMRSMGAKVIDADAIAHGVIRKGAPAYRRIVRVFGKRVLAKDLTIDRAALAAIVFDDPAALKKLNSIVHPEVIRIIRERLGKARANDVVVIDAPLLIEAGLAGIVDEIVVVVCTKKEQIKRCEKKYRAGRREVLKRIRSQMSLKRKMRMAHHVVDNSGTRSRTRAQVRRLWEEAVWR